MNTDKPTLDQVITYLTHRLDGMTMPGAVRMTTAARDYLVELQAENARLREELEYEREHANAYHEECGQWEAENEKLREKIEDARLEGYVKGLGEMSEENERLWAELEQVKQELDAAKSPEVLEAVDELMEFARTRMSTADWLYYVDVLGEWRGQKED